MLAVFWTHGDVVASVLPRVCRVQDTYFCPLASQGKIVVLEIETTGMLLAQVLALPHCSNVPDALDLVTNAVHVVSVILTWNCGD